MLISDKDALSLLKSIDRTLLGDAVYIDSILGGTHCQPLQGTPNTDMGNQLYGGAPLLRICCVKSSMLVGRDEFHDFVHSGAQAVGVLAASCCEMFLAAAAALNEFSRLAYYGSGVLPVCHKVVRE